MKPSIGMTYDLRGDYLAEGYAAEDVAEFDSESTIDSLEQALRDIGQKPVRIGHARELCSRLVRGERWDLVFNIAEGLRGRSREAQVPCILETYGIPYTMSDPLVCALTLDKALSKKIVRAAGCRTPDGFLVTAPGELDGVRPAFPLFAKPVAEGTGKGIDCRSKVENRAQLMALCAELLARYRQPVLVEEYLPGREFTVGILGSAGRASVLGTMEIEVLPSQAGGVYSLETKEKCEEQIRYSPLEKGALRTEIEDLALTCHVALECRDASRVDIKLDSGGHPSFMEVNALPGLHPTHSDLPMIATQEGMSYRDLIAAIVNSAMERSVEPPASPHPSPEASEGTARPRRTS